MAGDHDENGPNKGRVGGGGGGGWLSSVLKTLNYIS